MPIKHSSGFKNCQKQIKILTLHMAKVNSASAESTQRNRFHEISRQNQLNMQNSFKESAAVPR
jgi:hypothetical protein